MAELHFTYQPDYGVLARNELNALEQELFISPNGTWRASWRKAGFVFSGYGGSYCGGSDPDGGERRDYDERGNAAGQWRLSGRNLVLSTNEGEVFQEAVVNEAGGFDFVGKLSIASLRIPAIPFLAAH
eukprot:gnl/Spiro4/9876_TR5234_c0_g1_i1.p1 gnl/Spiro4/9876_TR5234_c0_g1~~gnl/Spiro4/9876_TR5234_c0_g1_i1.p1  ORF type:complete len:137 (-),score=20.51 gnl/Spiro4/9876_TR5234_c0_g1_i1:111-494(-)